MHYMDPLVEKSNMSYTYFMRLTVQTDYALRVLMYLAVNDGQYRIEEIAAHYDISKNHLMKVAQRLSTEGFIKSTRGRGGGLMLAHPAAAINLGRVARRLEGVDQFVECFDPGTNNCRATPSCGLKHALAGGVEAFMKHLDQFTLADLVRKPTAFLAAA